MLLSRRRAPRRGSGARRVWWFRRLTRTDSARRSGVPGGAIFAWERTSAAWLHGGRATSGLVRTRSLGKTGLEVTELALGTWGLSGDAYGPVAREDAEKVVARAVELGVTLFETSDAYGRGAAEEILCAQLAASPDAVVVTKLGTDRASEPARKRFDPAWLREAAARSAERLGRAPVALLHNPTASAVSLGEATGVLAELTASGTLRSWGVSAGDADVARAALAAGAPVLEVAYNAFHVADLHPLTAAIAEAGAGLLARSVLAHGLLAGMWRIDRVFAEHDHRSQRWAKDELRTRIMQLGALRPLVSKDVLTLRAVALRFVLANDLVSSAVIGPRSVMQLEQLAREAGKGPPYLLDAALARLPDDLERLGLAW